VFAQQECHQMTVAIALQPNAAVAASLAPAVEAVGIDKAYRRGAEVTSVLRGVNLRVASGECVCLVGPSGSGKSTLLSILGCILQPDRGRLVLRGEEVRAGRLVEFRRRRIGFVFQAFRLVRGLTALDNVCVPSMLSGTPLAEARERAAALLADVGLPGLAHAVVDQLSAGQCQRVALARALANDPELILADEPTAALDAHTGRQVMELLRALLAAHGKTAIIVTHDPRVVQATDRVYSLTDGQLVASRQES
jgi:putative ABC transport system ATP-binding protein